MNGSKTNTKTKPRCPVCLNTFRKERVAIVCPNRHGVCHACFSLVMQQRRTNNKCPICRERLCTPMNSLYTQTWPAVLKPEIRRLISDAPANFGGLTIRRSQKGTYVVFQKKRQYVRRAGRGWTWKDRRAPPPDPWAHTTRRCWRGHGVRYSARPGYYCNINQRRVRLSRSGRGWKRVEVS